MLYFHLAAPLHHQDEELYVFPPFLARLDESIKPAVYRLLQGHLCMEVTRPKARALLLQVAEPAAATWAGFSTEDHAALDDSAGRFAKQIQTEETPVDPLAQAVLQGPSLIAISADIEHGGFSANSAYQPRCLSIQFIP